MKTLWADLETFSRRDIKNGPHQYAEDCYVLLFGYAIDDEPAKVWDLTVTETMPEDLRAALADPAVNTVWHNGANFDVPVLRKAKNLHVDLPFERVDDCMVKAYSHGLTGVPLFSGPFGFTVIHLTPSLKRTGTRPRILIFIAQIHKKKPPDHE